MTITTKALADLAAQLPELQFSSDKDCAWPLSDLSQAYLDFYGINFAKEFTQVKHGFGCVFTEKFRIAAHYWLPVNPQGSLVIVHGYYDHVGIYDHVIRFALTNNLAILAFDLPGHGLSSGEPAVIDSFNDYADVLASLLVQSKKIFSQPMYAIGQSTGCAVILNYLWRYALQKKEGEQFKKIVLCAPLILPQGWRGLRMGNYLYMVLRHFIKKIKRGYARSSHDQTFNDFIMQHDLLQAKYLSLRWLGAMKEWHRVFSKFEAQQKDVLLLQGTDDMTVDWRYNVPLIQTKLPNLTLVTIAGAKHQLVNESETYRAQVFSAIQHYFI